MMRTYNTDKAIVFNTYQNYLKKAHKTIVLDLEQDCYVIDQAFRITLRAFIVLGASADFNFRAL